MKARACSFLLLLAVFCTCSGGQPASEDNNTYYPKDPKSFRLVSYNVGAFSKYISEGTGSTEMIAKMLLEVKADAVGLNECDSVNTRHSANQVADLAKALGGWQWWFGRAMPYKGGAYGNGALVPKGMQVIARYTVPLEKSDGSEPRSIAVMETDKYVIGAAHLDHKSAGAQLAQAAQVNAWASGKYKNAGKPVFFLGDMNAKPESATIKALKDQWDLLSATEQNTYPSSGAKSCIDYIFHYKASAPVKVVDSKVMTRFKDGDVTLASDHLPIYVDVELFF